MRSVNSNAVDVNEESMYALYHSVRRIDACVRSRVSTGRRDERSAHQETLSVSPRRATPSVAHLDGGCPSCTIICFVILSVFSPRAF